MNSDRALARAIAPEIRLIEDELLVYEDLLRRWQRTINLVAPKTLPQIWVRHFADSAHAYKVAPDARRWVDLGSGAGFPGLVTALLLKSTEGAFVHLIESDQRKAAFLRAVSRETSAPVEVLIGRIEDVLPSLPQPDAISARALGPLKSLLSLAGPRIRAGAYGVFFKGKDWRRELTGLPDHDKFVLTAFSSKSDERACIVLAKAGESH